jgi:hypothetical protein
MTTFQDPPPQSRRAVRQSERGEAEQVAYPPFTPTSQQFPDQREMWDTTQRRASQLPTTPPVPAAPASGRRAAPPLPAAEPLTYTTQGRAPVPTYDAPAYQAPAAELPPTQALPAQDQPTYRVRDYAPAAFAPAPTWTQEPAAPSDLDYQTAARIAPVEPVAPAAPAAPAVPEQTLTRRELRAMLHSEALPAEPELAEYAPPAPVAAAPVAAAAPAPADATEETAWPFAFGNEPVASAPVAAAPAPVAVSPAQPVEPATPADGARALFGDLMTPLSQPLPAVAPEATPNTAMMNAMAEFDALASAPAPVAPAAPAPVAPAPVAQEPFTAVPVTPVPATPEPTWTRPTGHWSTQAELDDETQPYESTINRKIGSGHATTNALVLPTIPDHDIRGALTGGGEIMLTGSIDLPASLGASGTTDRHDHDGLDALFEGGEHEIMPTDSQPVRAVRAISTHATGQGVTHTQKPKGNRVLTVLLIAASAMAVVGVGLLVAVVVMNML